MTDVAQILGVNNNDGKGQTAAAAAPPPAPPLADHPSRATLKVQGVTREIAHLIAGHYPDAIHSISLPPAVPTFSSGRDHVKVGNKMISTQKPCRKWAWAPFVSSARTDGALFRHWVRANVEYPDYAYARFDVHLDPVFYSDEEYKRFVSSDTWTRSETDQLMELARQFELRWPVIHDRWMEFHKNRSVEELQHRYYSVAAKIAQVRITQEATSEIQSLTAATPTTLSPSDDPSKIAATENLLIEAAAARALASTDGTQQPLIHNLGTGSTNKSFDFEYERDRRAHMNALWNRSKEDEQEEVEIRKELKQVEAQLRKLKKSGVHLLAASSAGGGPGEAGAGGVSAATATASSMVSSAASSRNASRSVSPLPPATSTIDTNLGILDSAFSSTAPTPTPQTPYLQSGRLIPPACGGPAGINKTLLIRMEAVLGELKIQHAKIIPTKRACDLYDSVRKDILTLLILQKNLLQKEGILQSKRLKLSKMMGGNVQVMDEEALMGIVPPPAPAPAVPVAASAASASVAARVGGASGGGKTKGAGNKAKAPPTAAGGGSSAAPTTTKTKAPAAAAKAKSEDAVIASSSAHGAAAAATSTSAAGKAGATASSGGKQPKKPSVKRKRKSDASKSPAPAATSTAAGAAATATPAVATGPTATAKSDEGKQTKKRAKKAPA